MWVILKKSPQSGIFGLKYVTQQCPVAQVSIWHKLYLWAEKSTCTQGYGTEEVRNRSTIFRVLFQKSFAKKVL